MAIVYDDDPKKKSRIVYDDEQAKQEPITQPLQDVGARMAERVRSAASAESIPEYLLQTAGNAAASIGDIGIGAASTLGKAYGKIDPRGAEAAKTAGSLALGKLGGAFRAPLLEKAGAALHQSPIGQGLDKIAGNERVMKNLGAGANLASLIPAERVMAPALRAATGGALGATKKAVEAAVEVPAMVGKGIGEPLKKAAKRNVEIEMRPGQWGSKRGYNSGNALKNDLVGKPREVAEKSQQMLNELNEQAKEIGAASTEKVSIPDLMAQARSEFSREGNIHDYDKITTFIDDLEQTYLKAHPTGEMSLSDAMRLRTQIGDKAAFVGARDKGGMTTDPDADWKEKIFNKLYGAIKDDIHAKAGPELQAINRTQSEIIPIRQVALRRLPISESNLRVGLMDASTIGAGAGLGVLSSGDEGDRTRNAVAAGIGLGLLRRGVGSKFMTRAMYKAGEKLSPTAEKPLKQFVKETPKETIAPEPITDERRLLPPPMVGGTQKIEPLIPTLGSKLREMGKPDYEAEGMTSKEIYNSKRRLGKLEEKKNLLGKLMKVENSKIAYPNYREGMEKSVLGKKGESGIVGSLKSERGSIGGGYDYVGTPAIRDPATGKIYTGDWRGHKGALTKAGDEEIEKRLRYEHFLDNTNKPTDNVGFIDKKGNFISRTEAEKMLQPKSSLSQMFHDEGFVGSRSETGNAAFDKFMGKEISPQYQALLKDPKTIEEMRTTLERLAPAERSAMVERLKKIYGPQWSEYGPLFGTLGIGAVGTGGGITAYEMARNKK